MCRWCENSLIADSLTSGLWGLKAGRRQFVGYAVSAGAAAAASLIPSFPAIAASGAEIIFRNGAIYPMTAARVPAEALAIGRGRILAVGSDAEVAAITGPATRIVDLQGRTVLPGLIDPHHHTVLAALLSDVLINVGYAKYPRHDAAVPALRAQAAKTAPGEWITAGFYDNLLQGGNFSMQELDAISTRHPIFVLYVNGHVGAVTRWPSSAQRSPRTSANYQAAAILAAAPRASSTV